MSINKPRLLSQLAHSEDVWQRRIAVLTTFHHIKLREFDATLMVADWLLNGRPTLVRRTPLPCHLQCAVSIHDPARHRQRRERNRLTILPTRQK